MIKICKFCNKQFNAHQNSLKFCSKKCYGNSKKGYTPWNKGKKGTFHHTKKMRKYLSDYRKKKPNRYWLGKKFSKKHLKKLSDHAKMESNPKWNGGIIRNIGGYISIKNNSHPFSGERGYVLEHRLVMEHSLGRYLSPKEVVHHINGIHNDNRIKNLMLFSNQSEHRKYHLASQSS